MAQWVMDCYATLLNRCDKFCWIEMTTLVVTLGSGAMALYSKFSTGIYQQIRERFNISWLSIKALRTIPEDCNFIRTLSKLYGIVHLPNQHLGRYVNFLKMSYIITVHDIIRYLALKGYGVYIQRPNLRDRFYLNLDCKGIGKAARIITIPRATKRDLMYYLGMPDEQINIIYPGVDRAIFGLLPHSRSFGYPYILFVGSEHPRKNLRTLLKAFEKLKKRAHYKDSKVVKVGKAEGAEANYRDQTMQVMSSVDLMEEVMFTEAISVEDLRACYCGAECSAFPSSYEGFSFPLLEAMACGCPVVTSDSSSLPEVVGDAAIKLSPYQKRDWTSCQVVWEKGSKKDSRSLQRGRGEPGV